MKNIFLGLLIGLIVGSAGTYIALNPSVIFGGRDDFDPRNYDPYAKIAKGFKVEYTDEWNNGSPFEEQELAYLRDVDYENHKQEPDATNS